MRVLRGAVHVEEWRTKDTWGTSQADRLLSHLSPKEWDDRYDLNQLWAYLNTNHDERWLIKMLWLLSKAVKRSGEDGIVYEVVALQMIHGWSPCHYMNYMSVFCLAAPPYVTGITTAWNEVCSTMIPCLYFCRCVQYH